MSDQGIFRGTEGIQLHLFEVDKHLDEPQDNIIFQVRTGNHVEYVQMPSSIDATYPSWGQYSIIELGVIGKQKRFIVIRIEFREHVRPKNHVAYSNIFDTFREAIDYIESDTGQVIKFRTE